VAYRFLYIALYAYIALCSLLHYHASPSYNVSKFHQSFTESSYLKGFIVLAYASVVVAL